MSSSTSFSTVYRPQTSPFSRPVDPEVLAIYGTFNNEVSPSSLESKIYYSSILGYYAEYEQYKYSEHQGFLIHNTPLKTAAALFFPSTPEDGVLLASRYNQSVHDAYFWHTQLEHRGLPTTGATEVAKIRILCADDQPILDSAVSETKDFLKLHVDHILGDPRRAYQYEQQRTNKIRPRKLIEEPAMSASSEISTFINNNWPEAIDRTVLPPEAFVGRFELAFYLDWPTKTCPEPAGELILALEPGSDSLYGRFRLPGDRRACHGLLSVQRPRAALQIAESCHVARETTRGSWYVVHPDEAGEEGNDAYVKFCATDIVVFGKSFWARKGATAGGEDDDHPEKVLVGVKRIKEHAGFGTALDEKIGGVKKPEIFRRMWEGVHGKYCEGKDC